MRTAKGKLAKRDAVRVKSAEMWLQMGKPIRAMKSLQRLTSSGWTHPWTENILWRAALAFPHPSHSQTPRLQQAA
jgi:hypothetical protein